MKFDFAAVLLGLVAFNSAMAADVLKQGVYSGDGCSGEPVFQVTTGFGGQCVRTAAAVSQKVSCSEIETFASNGNCEGSGIKTPVATGCVSVGGVISSKTECVAVPDGKIARYSVGAACEDGEVTGILSETFIVLDECQSFSSASTFSFKYSAVDGGIKVDFFTEKNDCTGASESVTIPVGECTLSSVGAVGAIGRRLQEGGEVAVKITPAIEGAVLGSNAMSASASAFAFFAAMIAAFAMA